MNHNQIRFVGPMERMIYFRTLPEFQNLPANEIALLAQLAKERVFKKDSVIHPAGEAVKSVYFLVEGKVRLSRNGKLLRFVEPPFGVGFLALLSRTHTGIESVAEIDTIALELSSDTLFDVFEDNFTILLQGIRQFSKQMSEGLQRLPSTESVLAPKPDSPYPLQPLNLIERLICIRGIKAFQKCSLDPLMELARHTKEIRLSPGEILWKHGTSADFGVLIVYGTILCDSGAEKRRFRAGPGFGLGFQEALAQLPRPYEGIAETKFVGLVGYTDRMIDVFEDHFEMTMNFMSFLATEILELYEQAPVVEN